MIDGKSRAPCVECPQSLMCTTGKIDSTPRSSRYCMKCQSTLLYFLCLDAFPPRLGPSVWVVVPPECPKFSVDHAKNIGFLTDCWACESYRTVRDLEFFEDCLNGIQPLTHNVPDLISRAWAWHIHNIDGTENVSDELP